MPDFSDIYRINKRLLLFPSLLFHLFSLYRVLEREILAYLPFIYIFCVYLSNIGEISIF